MVCFYWLHFFDYFFTHSCYFTYLVVVLLYTGHCGWDIVETGFCYLSLKCVDICSSRQWIVEAWFHIYLSLWEAQDGLPSLSILTEFRRHQTLSPLWCVVVQTSVQFFHTFNFCFLLGSLDSPLHMWSSGVRQGFEGIYMQIYMLLWLLSLCDLLSQFPDTLAALNIILWYPRPIRSRISMEL